MKVDVSYSISFTCVTFSTLFNTASSAAGSEDDGLEPRTVEIAARHSNHSAKSHPQLVLLSNFSSSLTLLDVFSSSICVTWTFIHYFLNVTWSFLLFHLYINIPYPFSSSIACYMIRSSSPLTVRYLILDPISLVIESFLPFHLSNFFFSLSTFFTYSFLFTYYWSFLIFHECELNSVPSSTYFT